MFLFYLWVRYGRGKKDNILEFLYIGIFNVIFLCYFRVLIEVLGIEVNLIGIKYIRF